MTEDLEEAKREEEYSFPIWVLFRVTVSFNVLKNEENIQV